MAEEALPEGFDAADIANKIAALSGGTPPAEEPKEEPKPEIEVPEGDGPPEIKVPERDDIVIRRKADKVEPEPEEEPTPEPEADPEPEEDPEDLRIKPKESNNFKALRESQKKYKKKAQDLEKEVEELRVYRDRVALQESPERYEAFEGARNKMVDQASAVGELYGLSDSDIKEVFSQEDIRSARQELESVSDDPDVVSELAPIIRDFYINKNKELKDLETEDPKSRLEELKAERENRVAAEKANKIKAANFAKESTSEYLKTLQDNSGDAANLWPGIYDKGIKKYIDTDLPKMFKEKSASKYGALHDILVDRGAELSLEDSRKVAMIAADASAGEMANQVINILLGTISKYEKELKIQTGNSNPGIRQAGKPTANTGQNTGPKSREAKGLELIQSLNLK